MNPKHIDLPLDAEQNMRDYYQFVLLPIKILFINQFEKYVFFKNFFYYQFLYLTTDILYSHNFWLFNVKNSILFSYILLLKKYYLFLYFC